MNKRVTICVLIAAVAAAFGLAVVMRFSSPRVVAIAETIAIDQTPVLDTAAYDAKLLALANVETATVDPATDASPGDASIPVTETLVEIPVEPIWPAEAVYPNVEALLPSNRIVAYYGNFYSTRMGVLGEYLPDTVVAMLKQEVVNWELVDPMTPVVPAIDYIAVVAQAGAGADGLYRRRMPDVQIQKAIAMAEQVDGIVILEVQAGLADVLTEVQALESYLILPQVHLAIDPEFAMATSGRAPGTVVGTVDATDVNAVAEHLAELVKTHSLSPKLLIVHRYTQAMVTNAANIAPLPEVQIIMDMDGWGPPAQKINTYESYISAEPVQFTGFKLFYHNDTQRSGSRLLTPEEILNLTPAPSFIQYQ